MGRSLTNSTTTSTTGDGGGGGSAPTSVSDLSDGSNVVLKTGSQTIGGSKVFTDSITTDQTNAAYSLMSKHGYLKARNTNTAGNAMVELESTLADTYVQYSTGSDAMRLGRFASSADLSIVNSGLSIPTGRSFMINGAQIDSNALSNNDRLVKDDQSSTFSVGQSFTAGLTTNQITVGSEVFVMNNDTANEMTFNSPGRTAATYVFRVNGTSKLTIADTAITVDPSIELHYDKTASPTGDSREVLNRGSLAAFLISAATSANTKGLIESGV